MKGIFLYRDGANYKFSFEADVPEGMEVGDETTYEALGYTQKEFHAQVVGYPYDEESDHNIVELVELTLEKV